MIIIIYSILDGVNPSKCIIDASNNMEELENL